jgi:hypothetical protein
MFEVMDIRSWWTLILQSEAFGWQKNTFTIEIMNPFFYDEYITKPISQTFFVDKVGKWRTKEKKTVRYVIFIAMMARDKERVRISLFALTWW